MSKDAVIGREWSTTEKDRGDDGADSEEWVPLSVREARRARKRREDVWPLVWMSFASVVIIAVALAILAYRMGERNCRQNNGSCQTMRTPSSPVKLAAE